MTVIGSFSIMASSGTMTAVGASPMVVRRLPSSVFLPNFFLMSTISSAIVFQRFFSSFSSAFSSVRSLVSASFSLRISISSSLRNCRSLMLRMASAGTSVRSKAIMSCALASSCSRMMLITSSRLRYAANKPPRTSNRCSILPRRYLVRRIRTS